MDKISRKQRQIERKVENLKRFGAEEEKYKSSPNIKPITKATTKTSTNEINKNENSINKTNETLKKDEEKSTENKPKTIKIIKKKIATEKTDENVKEIKKENENQNNQQILNLENVPRTFKIFITINDYLPQKEEEDEEKSLFNLDEGQCVEVLDNNNPEAWLVRTKTKPPSIGFVPGYYFTSPTRYYSLQRDSSEKYSIKKLLQTEEEFIGELKLALDYYVKVIEEENDKEKSSKVPQAVKERQKELLVSNIELLYNFHLNIFLKAIKECSEDITNFAEIFFSLENNFKEIHLPFLKELENALRLCQHVDVISQFLEEIRSKQSTIKQYTDYLELIPNRIRYYEDFFKELINKTQNYCTEEVKKCLNFLLLLEQHAKEPDFTKLIVGYSEDVNSLGHIYRHELFQVWEDGDCNNNTDGGDKYIFLFNNIILITIKEEINSEILFRHYATIKLNNYSTVRKHTTETLTLVLAPNDSNKELPSYLFRTRRENNEEAEIVCLVWINDICQMQQRAMGG